MPYFRERFVNRTLPQSRSAYTTATGKPKVGRSNTAVMDSVEMLSYRSRPHPRAVGQSQIVEDIVADPYANFLNSTSERQYREALEARGLTAKGSPDRGHAFQLTRHTVMTRPKSFAGSDAYDTFGGSGLVPTLNVGSRHAAYSGVFNGGVDCSVIPYQEQPLSAFAQSAYSRVAPTSEVFNAATFLGELREGLPRLVPEVLQESIRAARQWRRPDRDNRSLEGVGSDYLNFQFGWLPLVSDVQNAATALARATAQLASDGKRVHRKYAIPSETTTGLFDVGNTVMSSNSGSILGLLKTDLPAQIEAGLTGTSWQDWGPTGSGSIHKMRRRERWFEGEFSSFYRLGFDPSSYLDRLDALVNVNVTPEVLWELAPWSWLVDWNLRLGDSIRANQLASSDRLVMHYGYAMETVTYRSLHSAKHPDSMRSGSYFSGGFGTSSDTSITTTYKRRIRANPYGFRVNTPSAFTGGQLAILGALGLTKL